MSVMKNQAVNIGLRIGVRLPNCPKQLTLEDGGTLATSALTDKQLEKIADEWRKVFFERARPLQTRGKGDDE